MSEKLLQPSQQEKESRFQQRAGDDARRRLEQIEAIVRAWRVERSEGALEIEMPAKWVIEQIIRAANPVRCVCGDPSALGTVHRVNGPCFVYASPTTCNGCYHPDHEPGSCMACNCASRTAETRRG